MMMMMDDVDSGVKLPGEWSLVYSIACRFSSLC